MRILVTGGAGFIGSWVAETLARRGEEVIIADHLRGGQNHAIVPIAQLDLASDDLTPITRFAPEVVFHAAANAREGASQFQPAAVTAAGLMATARCAEAAILGGRLVRWVQCSSMARYGDAHLLPFDEASAPQPVDVYGWNKVAIEGALRALGYVHGFKVSVLVPHNVIGVRQCLRDRFRNVAAITMNRIMRGEPIIIFGDGGQKRAFSAIEDALPCFVRACYGAADSLTVNVGGTKPITINDLVAAVRDDMGAAANYPVRHLPERPLDVRNAWCTARRSQQLLGYEERVGWRDCIRAMAAWAKTQGPQPWSEEKLALDAPSRPEVWK